MQSSSLRFLLVALALVTLASCASPGDVSRPCPTYGVLTDAETMTAFSAGGQDRANVMYRATLGNAALTCEYHGVRRRLPGGETPMPGTKIEPGIGPSTGGYLSYKLGPRETAALACQSDTDSGNADDSDNADSGNADESGDQEGGRRRGRRGPAKIVHVTGDLKFDLSVSRGSALTDTKITVPYFVAVMRNQKYVLAREEFTASFDLGGKSQVARRIDVPIDIPLASKMTGASYQVIVGLSLTPEQLAYNRQHRGP